MRRLRTGLAGCGKVGQIHAEALAGLPESEFAAVCDADPARGAAFAARYGARAFSSVSRMLSEARLDAVVVATPHPAHAEAAVAAAERGVHVLVEKPLAASLADCDAMIGAADRSGVRLGVISQRRLYEPALRVKKAIEAGKIGKPVLGLVLMFNWRDAAYYRSDPWRGQWRTEGGGVLVNQAPHQLDLLLWYMGPAGEVSGYWANLNHPDIEVEDTALAIARFRNGGLGSVAVSVSQKPGLFTRIHIHGSNGASVGVETETGASFIAGVSGAAGPPRNDLWTVPGEEGRLAAFEAEDRARFGGLDLTTHYHRLQIQDFLRAAIEDREPMVTGLDGRRVVEFIEAIYRSNRGRAPVRLPLS